MKEIRSKANTTKAHNDDKTDTESDKRTFLGYWKYVAKNKDAFLATGSNDLNWYFDNSTLYYMI